MTPESEPGRRIAELERERAELERERAELQDAIKTMSEAHHAAFEVERKKVDELTAKVSFTHSLERLRDDLASQLKESKTEVAQLKAQLAQAQCKLAQLQQVAALYGFDDTGWLSPDEAAKLRQEVAAQKLHIEHLESCLLNLNQERMEEAAKLLARLERYEKALKRIANENIGAGQDMNIAREVLKGGAE